MAYAPDVVEVQNIKKIDGTKFRNGDIFITGTKSYMLVEGKPKPLTTTGPNMKEYIKKDELDGYLREVYPHLFKESGGK